MKKCLIESGQRPPGTDIYCQPLKQVVRILLECILVDKKIRTMFPIIVAWYKGE